MSPRNFSAMDWKTSPQPTSLTHSTGTTQNITRALHKQDAQPKEEPPMNTAIVATTPTVSPFIQNLQQQQPQKPQTSKEAIAANVKALIEQLEEGHSEGLTAYLM